MTQPDPSSDADTLESITGGWEPRRVFEVVLGVPATEGNQVRVLRNGDRIFPAMLDAIASAQRTIDFLTFVYWTGLEPACGSGCCWTRSAHDGWMTGSSR